MLFLDPTIIQNASQTYTSLENFIPIYFNEAGNNIPTNVQRNFRRNDSKKLSLEALLTIR